MVRGVVPTVLAAIFCASCGAENTGRNTEQCVERAENVAGDSHNWAPAWSPDGKYLAFSSTRAIPEAVYVLDVSTCQLRRLTEGTRSTWSPDGKRLAIEREVRDGGPNRIFIVGADGRAPRMITNDDPSHRSSDGSPAWSPRNRILFLRAVDADPQIEGFSGYRIISVRPNGQDPQLVADAKSVLGSPSWSPDGRIAFICEDSLAVCITNADRGGNRIAIRALRDVQTLDWSPDGRTIVFSGNGEEGGLTLFTSPAAGGKPKLLPSTANGDDPSWSPAGQWIAFSLTEERWSDLYLIRPDGTGLRRLTRPPPEISD